MSKNSESLGAVYIYIYTSILKNNKKKRGDR